jgi:hypothetical protein
MITRSSARRHTTRGIALPSGMATVLGLATVCSGGLRAAFGKCCRHQLLSALPLTSL